jgi:outer membrane protein TolC
VPGFYNGVLIARVNTDISVADFEIGLRDLVSNVENAYWDLYFAYRDLDAKIQARNAALDAWKRIKILLEKEQGSGLLEREAQAREQYFRYEEEVQNALAGTLQSATTNNNGASGGSFRGVGGVLVSERRLRLAIGLPITDGRLIRPADEPTFARVEFAWASASDDAIARRPELLRQRHVIKRREMEYVAARNFLLPRFDVFGKYRVRGMGEDLIGDATSFLNAPSPVGPFANSSLANLASGDFQEWQLGGEVSLPIGFRRGWAGVRNAQLNLARDKAILEEQERQVIHDLSNAVGDMQRAYQIMETTYNRRLAAQQNADILSARLEKGQPVSPEQVLEGERRLSDADIQYHRALVEHMLAIKNVHFEKGTLLQYGRIQLAEQLPPSSSGAAPGQSASVPPAPTPAATPIPLPPPSSPAPAPLPQSPAPVPPPLPNFPSLEQPVGVPPVTESIMFPHTGSPAATPPFMAPAATPFSSRQPSNPVPPRDFGLPPRGPMSNWTPATPASSPQTGSSTASPTPVVTVSPSTGLIERTWFLKEPAVNPAGTVDTAIPTYAPARNTSQATWTPPSTTLQLPVPTPLMRLPPPEAEPRRENAPQRLPSL